MNMERQKFLFQGKLPLAILFGILINLLTLSNSFAEAANHTILLFLGNKNIAPVVYLDNSTPSGVAVDIVHALAKHIPQPIEIKVMDWSEAQALVARGEADALIQINQTEERKRIYDFSDTLLESQFSIFTRSNKMGISGPSSLRGLRVGVESGGLPRQVLEKSPRILLTIIPNFLEGFKMLNEGSIDAVVVDYRVGSYILAENNIRNIKVTGEPIAFSYSSFAVKKGNIKLLNAINNALQIIKADGTYQNIIDKWKPKEVVFQTREQITQKIYYVTILILLIVFLIAAIWMVILKRELTKRKAAEEGLREQYSTLRSIINSANALIFSVDRQHRYTSFNQGHAAAMKALYGAEIEQGHSMLDYMTVPEDRDAARRNLDRALAGEQIVEEAYSGEELRSRQYFQVSHSPIKTEEEIIGVAVLAQDMTERKRAEGALHRLNRELRAISNCNQVLVRAEDEQTLLNDICRIICDDAGYRMAWVGYAENDDARTVRPVAWAGVEEGYLANSNITWADTERGRGPSGTAMRTGKTDCIHDFTTDPHAAPWQDNALQRGYRSSISLPLKDEGAKTFGVLNIYSTEPNAFTTDEKRLLEELSGDLAFGIMVLRARTERKRAEEEVTWNLAINQAIASLYIPLVTAGTNIEQIANVILEKSRQLTSSAHGFVAEVDPSTGDQIAHTLTRMMQTECKVEEELRKIRFPRRADGFYNGLWGHALNTKEPFYTNAPAKHHASVGIPDGHMVIERFLAVPVLLSGELAGQIALSNSARAYTDRDLDAVNRIAELYALAIQRKRAEAEIFRLNADLEQRIVERTNDLETKRLELQENQLALINIVEDLNAKSEELRQANTKLQELDRLKSMFIASMSHELRTPLNSIIGFSSILHDGWIGPVNTEQKENLAIILRSGKHLLSLINDVIDVSKIESGKIEISYEDFDVYDVISEAVELFKKDVHNKGLDLKVQPIHLVMHTDRRRLFQCIVNLMSNAVKFTEKGIVWVQARVILESGIRNPEFIRESEDFAFPIPHPAFDGNFVEISVEDTGIGIKEGDISRLFGAFVRVHSFQVTAVKGTGLGLYLTKKIVTEILGGEISVEGNYGKGSRFVIRIPVKWGLEAGK